MTIPRALRNASRYLATAAAALSAACAVASAHPNARFYRGDIVVSSSWEGVIRLTGKVVIREGVTVTVDPGTEVLVQPGVENDIEVRGRLLVRGIPEKPVLFDTAGGCAAGPWGGILILGERRAVRAREGPLCGKGRGRRPGRRHADRPGGRGGEVTPC